MRNCLSTTSFLRTNIKEAKRAGLLNVLLNPINLGTKEQALLLRELELWREWQSRSPMDCHAEALVEFIGIREDWALQQVTYITTAKTSGGSAAPATSSGRRSYERRDARVMAIRTEAIKDVNFPPPKGWAPNLPWFRPCVVEGCREEHAPTKCPLFKAKSPQDRLAVVRKKELCTFCFRHLDTRRCWSLGRCLFAGSRGAEWPTTHYCMMSCKRRR
jgi:hypothetical protein